MTGHKPKFFGDTWEDRLLAGVFVVMAVVHVLFLLAEEFSWLEQPEPVSQEWVVEAEVVTDVQPSAPEETALPKSKEAEDPKAPEQMLPQLPKKFAIKKPTQTEEAVSEEPVEKPEEKIEKADEKVEAEKTETPPPDEDEANKVDKAEALKRAALEKLRKQEKTAKTAEAPKESKLARLREEVEKREKLNAGTFGSPSAKGERQKYAGTLKEAVRRNYALPEAFNLKEANVSVVVSITVSARGDLMDMKVRKSSGDPAFDELTTKAVRSSAPLPKPPRELAGTPILLRFTP